MIVPLLIVGGGVLAISLVSRPARPMPVEQVSGVRRVHGQRPRRREVTPCIEMVAKHLRLGIMPSEQLVFAAVREAERIGNYRLAEALWNAGERVFLKKIEQPEEAEPQREQLPESPDETDVPQIASPLEGVADDEWQDFILAMRDKDPNFENERHVGAFHHSKSRIAKLGIDPSKVRGNEALQVDLFQKDLASRAEEASDLINAVAGHEIEIDGSTHVITKSGVLALIKVAGPERARDWIEDPSSREKFPKTKELFLKCNLLF